MSLNTAIQLKSLTATLHYLKRGVDKPTRYVEDPPPGVPQWNGIDNSRQIAIEDAHNPLAAGAPLRESIEVRALEFY